MASPAQSPNEIIMVRPKNFAYDPETAASNAFQNKPDGSIQEMKAQAQREFDTAVDNFRAKGVRVKVFEDRDSPLCPDAIFPNNWFSMHADGTVVLYPMASQNRRMERRQDVVDYLKETRKVRDVVDLSGFEKDKNAHFLEGTGSIVFDHAQTTAYACLSLRTDEKLFRDLCQKLGYKAVVFTAKDERGNIIYHTNVMMWIGTKVVGICLSSIADAAERKMVLESLQPSGRKIVDLSFREMDSFAGNCYELVGDGGSLFLAISKKSANALTAENLAAIKSSLTDLIVCDVDTIEHVGGGGIRCMMAGNFLPEK